MTLPHNDNRVVMGVTGHRNLPSDKIPAITKAIKDFYTQIEKEQQALSVTVLSPMADGADMLCAKLALEMRFRLVASLPMSASKYREDFSGSAAAAFDSIISIADEVCTVMPEEPVPDCPANGFFYRQAGLHVARCCNVLLAVWDGAESDTPDGAGTWETVKLARKFGKPVYRAWA